MIEETRNIGCLRRDSKKTSDYMSYRRNKPTPTRWSNTGRPAGRRDHHKGFRSHEEGDTVSPRLQRIIFGDEQE